MVKPFEEGFILIHNCDITDFVDLMKSFYAVFDQFGKVHHGLNCVRNTL